MARDMDTDREAQQEAVRQRMAGIAHKVLVLSGKGGVGKSTVAVHLALSLCDAGMRVGLLDIDLHGPSVPTLLGLEGSRLTGMADSLLPVEMSENFKVMSIGFLLPSRDDAVIWRGPRKYGAIQQFLKDVAWGELDYLIVDSPPGTGDEPLAVVQLIENADGAIVVTTPQEVAVTDVRKCVTFCRQLNLPVLGIVENMSGFVCPHCGQRSDIFKHGGGEALAGDMGVPFLGSIPIDPQIVVSGDAGGLIKDRAHPETCEAFAGSVRALLALAGRGQCAVDTGKANMENHRMKLAIPLTGGCLSTHFGHCEEFALVEVDRESKTIIGTVKAVPPAHEPGVLPRWLAEQGAGVIIAGGMGQRAQQLFADNGITVLTGAPAESPEVLVQAYLDETLQTGPNVCDH